MVEGITELKSGRRARQCTTLQRLEDDELRARVEHSYVDAERTIEEWHDFVEALDVAMRAMRACRRSELTRTTRSSARLAS